MGGREHEELGVPAGEPEEIDRRIGGRPGMAAGYFGARLFGRVPRVGSFGGKGAVDPLVLLAGVLREDHARFEEAVVDDRASVSLCHPFCGRDDPHQGVTDGERERAAAVRGVPPEACSGVPLTIRA